MSPWESIVTSAREIDGAFGSGTAPDLSRVMQLARAIVDFQQHLVGARVLVQAPPTQEADTLAAAAE